MRNAPVHPTCRELLSIHAGGHRLAALRVLPADAPAGPTLVFLHEGLGCIGFWKDFPDALCARLGLPGLVYDRWGYGASDPFDRPRVKDYLQDEAFISLPEVLSACGIDRPILVGHSDGASIALLYAAAFPQKPVAVVSLAAHVFVEEEALAGIRRAMKEFSQGDLRRRLERHHGEKTKRVFDAWADTWLSPAFRDWNIEAMLPHIRAALLVLQGVEDEYGTAAQVEAIVRAVSGPVLSHLLPHCGHAPHLQAPERVLDLATDFIRRYTGG
jgi:pimeloyl-ACP methyl ester carboxylesterase